MWPFNFDFRKFVLLIAFGSLSMLILNTQRQGNESKILAPFSLVVSLVNTSYANFSHGVKETAGFYLNLIQIKRQNAKLQQDNSELQTRLNQFEEILKENERLNGLLDFKKTDKLELIPARVMGIDMSPDYDTISINRGTRDGLKPFMAVISTEGVVGYIFRPQRISSQVLLLSDRNAVIDAHILRSRARGLVEGHSRDKLRMTHLLRADDVIVGDVVVTSGINQIFPKGFPIGKVISVEKDSYGISQTAEVEPKANPFNLDEVFVIKKVLKSFEDETEPPLPPAPSPIKSDSFKTPAKAGAN